MTNIEKQLNELFYIDEKCFPQISSELRNYLYAHFKDQREALHAVAKYKLLYDRYINAGLKLDPEVFTKVIGVPYSNVSSLIESDDNWFLPLMYCHYNTKSGKTERYYYRNLEKIILKKWEKFKELLIDEKTAYLEDGKLSIGDLVRINEKIFKVVFINITLSYSTGYAERVKKAKEIRQEKVDPKPLDSFIGRAIIQSCHNPELSKYDIEQNAAFIKFLMIKIEKLKKEEKTVNLVN